MATGSMSNYLEGKIADCVLRGSTYTSPGQLYLALFTSNPAEDGSGTECTYTGYARKSCGATPSAAFSSLDASGLSQSQNTITFDAVGGASNVTVTHWALFDAITAGNMLLYGPLDVAKTYAPTDVASFPVNALQLTFD